jgi:hypothetical protein
LCPLRALRAAGTKEVFLGQLCRPKPPPKGKVDLKHALGKILMKSLDRARDTIFPLNAPA